MFMRVLKFAGINFAQTIVLSSIFVIGKNIYRRIKINHINQKYGKLCEEYENQRNKSEIGKKDI